MVASPRDLAKTIHKIVHVETLYIYIYHAITWSKRSMKGSMNENGEERARELFCVLISCGNKGIMIEQKGCMRVSVASVCIRMEEAQGEEPSRKVHSEGE